MISAVVPTISKDCDKILDLVSSLYFKDTSMEVVLVVQGASYEEREKLSRKLEPFASKLKLVFEKEKGLSLARNIGVRESCGEYILLVDDDVKIPKESMENLLKLLSNLREGVGGYGRLFIEETSETYLRWQLSGPKISFWNYNLVCSVMLVIPRSFFEKVGLFDEKLGAGRFFGSGEESDFVIRCLQKNLSFEYMPEYVLYHERHIVEEEKTISYAKGTAYLYFKHFPSRAPLFFKMSIDIIIRSLMLFTFQRKRFLFFVGFLQGLTHALRTRNQ